MLRQAKPIFAHVVYRTHQFEKMLDWYQTVFVAHVQYKNDALAFLTNDEEHHRFAIANLDILDPDAKTKSKIGKVGVDHVAYSFGSLSDLLEFWKELRAKGLSPYWCLHHGITVSIYYADPDGNQLEFQVDAFDTSEAANEFMRGSLYAANPIGVEFDPEDWLTRLHAGEREETLLVRTVHEPVPELRGEAVS